MMRDGENIFFSFVLPHKVVQDVKYCVLSSQEQNCSLLSQSAFLLPAKTLKDYAYHTGDIAMSYRRVGGGLRGL